MRESCGTSEKIRGNIGKPGTKSVKVMATAIHDASRAAHDPSGGIVHSVLTF